MTNKDEILKKCSELRELIGGDPDTPYMSPDNPGSCIGILYDILGIMVDENDCNPYIGGYLDEVEDARNQ